MKVELKNTKGDIIYVAKIRECKNPVKQKRLALLKAIKSGVNLHGVTLERADLSGIDFKNSDLSEANLRKANLSGAKFEKATLDWSDLRDANLENSVIIRSSFNWANMGQANLKGSWILATSFNVANISYSNLDNSNITICDMDKADLSGATIDYAELNSVNLTEALLTESSLCHTRIQDSNLKGACLCGATMTLTTLNNRCNLSGVNFSGASLDSIYGDMEYIKSMRIEDYPIAYTHNRLQIGCEHHTIDEWESFKREDIIKMDGERGWSFWKKWKKTLLQIIEMSPALD